jgi:carnitine-CoA ligase
MPDSALPFRFAEAARTIPHLLQAQAAALGAAPLFACGDERWSYAETPAIAATMAGVLQAAGVGFGDRVAILSRNRPEVMRILLGCAWRGAIAVPINAGAKGPQLQHILADSGASLLMAEPDLLAALPAGTISAAALRRVWLIGDAVAPLPMPVATEPLPSGTDAIAPAAVEPGTPFAVLYTSGTTGLPKGVVCPHAQFYWWAAFTCRFLEVRPGDVLATALPLFHTNAINTFFQALLSGSSQVVLPRFSVSDFWPAMRRHGATVSYLLGAMVPMLLSRAPASDERAHAVRTILAPGVPPALHAAFRARTGIPLVDGFGSTETNFVIGDTASARVDGQIGRVAPGVEARLVDAAGSDAEVGELLLRTALPHAFATGYFKAPDKTAEAWRDGWFHTGDRLRRETSGAFAFVDRLKDSIRRRGENISSFEVEAALLSHPAVAEVAVFGVASDLAEEEVMATLSLKPAARAAPDDLARHAATMLPAFAVPRYIDIVAALPVTENGKITKAPLKQRGVTPTTWDRQATERRS